MGLVAARAGEMGAGLVAVLGGVGVTGGGGGAAWLVAGLAVDVEGGEG